SSSGPARWPPAARPCRRYRWRAYRRRAPLRHGTTRTPRARRSAVSSRSLSLPRRLVCLWFCLSVLFLPARCRSERVRTRLAGADAQCRLHGRDEDLAVADLAGVRRLLDGLDGALDLAVVDHDLDLHLGQETHQVFGAAIDLGLALLATEPLDLAHRQAGHADARQGIAHLVEFERLDDGRHEFHGGSSCLRPLQWPKNWPGESFAGPEVAVRREATAEGNPGGGGSRTEDSSPSRSPRRGGARAAGGGVMSINDDASDPS